MKLGKVILDFLFGKDPDIFDESGEVRHNLGDPTWRAWEARFRGPEYNWRNHSGTRPHLSSSKSSLSRYDIRNAPHAPQKDYRPTSERAS